MLRLRLVGDRRMISGVVGDLHMISGVVDDFHMISGVVGDFHMISGKAFLTCTSQTLVPFVVAFAIALTT